MASVDEHLLATPARSDSLKSVASSTSAVSLTRRSRVRSRSGTLQSKRGRSLGPPEEKDMIAKLVTDEVAAAYPLQSPTSSQPGPSRPHTPIITSTPLRGKVSQRPGVNTEFVDFVPRPAARRAATTESSGDIDSTGRGRNQVAGPSEPKGTRRPRSLPRRIMGSMSSDSSAQFSPVTTVAFQTPPVDVRGNQSSNRDSLQSQHSGNSSSVYPPSTPTASNHDRTFSPVLPTGKERASVAPPIQADVAGYRDFDADDVSLRLRLLVNNNYFLPPAHSKPTAADLASSNVTAKKLKVPSPSFLDIFRIGKLRSRPTTPVTPTIPVDLLAPKLRTTSDATTSTGFHHSHSSPQTPVIPATPTTQQGRVVVVREKVDNLIMAAKLVDQEGMHRIDIPAHPKGNPKRQKEEHFDGIIDPTDAVDLPPPSNYYPFALQASAMQGIGIKDSVGAAMLAERLPPPRSPGLSSFSTEEEIWRKDILQKAVGHSFKSTPDSSFVRKSSGRSTATAPSVMTTDREPSVSSAPSLSTKHPPSQFLVGQPILPPALLNRHVQHSPSMPKLDINRSAPYLDSRLLRKLSAPEFHNSFNPPIRADTPVNHATPLTPAPRKQIVNPIYSLSQSDLGDPQERQFAPSPSPSSHSLPNSRKSASSNRLSDVYEAGVNTGRSIMSPPPVFVRGPEGSPLLPSNRTLASEASGSHYFDDDEADETWYGTAVDTDDALPLSRSLPPSSRPSISDGPYNSPTASAFHDALFDHNRSASPFTTELATESSSRSSFRSAASALQYPMASPPPRASSSFAGHILPPPPRVSRRPRSSPDRSSDIPPETLTILGPEPTTPPLPIADRRGTLVLPLHIPGRIDPPAVHSAPPTNSSLSFFDNIQSDLNAMDDSSDDSSDDEDHHQHPRQSSAFGNTQMRSPHSRPYTSPLRSSLTRFGNNSTPQLGSSASAYPTFDPHAMNPPVANVPPKPVFFVSRKGVKGNQGISVLDLVPPPSRTSSLPSEHPLEGRKSSGSQKTESGARRSQDESSRKLDGMVMRHLEAERDTLKRIAASTKIKS